MNLSIVILHTDLLYPYAKAQRRYQRYSKQNAIAAIRIKFPKYKLSNV